MLLSDAVDLVVAGRELEKSTIDQYRRSVRSFSEFLNTPATTEHLSEDIINRWLMTLQQRIEGVTTRNYRVSITVVWNFLTTREDFKDIRRYDIHRIRKPKIDEKPVYAWSINQLRCLSAASKEMPGRLRIGISAANFMYAWLWVGYDTGLRPSDLRLLRWDAIDLDRTVVAITQHKTRHTHTAMLGPESCAALTQIYTERDLVFPLTKGGVRRWELRLFDKATADHGFKRRYGQGIGTLRKTHATEVYIVDGEVAAAESLGHKGGVRTVRRSYIDARAKRQGRLPPRTGTDYGRNDD